jgi:hypothetical protein
MSFITSWWSEVQVKEGIVYFFSAMPRGSGSDAGNNELFYSETGRLLFKFNRKGVPTITGSSFVTMSVPLAGDTFSTDLSADCTWTLRQTAP